MEYNFSKRYKVGKSALLGSIGLFTLCGTCTEKPPVSGPSNPRISGNEQMVNPTINAQDSGVSINSNDNSTESEDARKAKEVEDARKAKEVEDARIAKEVEDARKAKEVEDARKAKEVEDAKKAKEAEDAKKAKEAEEAKKKEEEDKKKSLDDLKAIFESMTTKNSNDQGPFTNINHRKPDLLKLASENNYADLLLDLFKKIDTGKVQKFAWGNSLGVNIVVQFDKASIKEEWGDDSFYDDTYAVAKTTIEHGAEIVLTKVSEGYYFIKLQNKNGDWQYAAIVPDAKPNTAKLVYSSTWAAQENPYDFSGYSQTNNFTNFINDKADNNTKKSRLEFFLRNIDVLYSATAPSDLKGKFKLENDGKVIKADGSKVDFIDFEKDLKR